MSVIISDLNPIQFWLVAEDTFNESKKDGITNGRTFFQYIAVGEGVSIQLFDTVARDYRVNIYNDDGTVLAQQVMSSVSVTGGTLYYVNQAFALLITAGLMYKIDIAYYTYGTVPRDGCQSLDLTTDDAIGGPPDTVRYTDCDGNIHNVTVPHPFGHVVVDCAQIGTDSVISGAVDIAYGDCFGYIPTLVAKTDCCIAVDTTLPGNKLIRYSNTYNYAGIDFTTGFGLPHSFGVVLHAKFYEEPSPEENESEGLTNGEVVKLSSTVKAQKLLEVEPIPPYMIRKLKYVFNCNTIKLENKYWEKEGAVEYSKLDDRFGLFPAKILLTERFNRYIHNVYGPNATI